jgi:PAS domain S-box-containing protein
MAVEAICQDYYYSSDTGYEFMELKERYSQIELEHFAAIIENSDDAIISKDLDGIIRSWNPGAEKLYGYTRDEAVGQNVSLLIPVENFDEEPEILDKIRSGEKIDHYETVRITKDGKRIPVSITVSPIVDEYGIIVGASKIARDISGVKEAETKKAMLAAIVESSDDAIVSKTLDGIITSWNRAAERLFEYTEQEVIGQSIAIIFPEDRLDEEPKIIEKIKRGERVEHFDTIRRSKSGKLIDISLTISPIRNDAGVIIGASKIARDIRERKHQQEMLEQKTLELERSNKELNDFAYIISHDLKAPLRAIGTLADFIQLDYAEKLGDEGKEQLNLLVGRVKRMYNLIEGVLQYSKVGRTRERIQEIDVDRLLKEIVDGLDVPESVKVTWDNMPLVVFEKVPLQQILQNLISNAIKFMDKPQGLVNITFRDRGTFMEFAITDNGMGIEQRFFEKIFQIFQTLQSRDEYENTGIGLTIVKKIVNFYHGRIWLTSVPGEGSTFYFTLPKMRGNEE